MKKPVLCIPTYSRPDGIAIERCKDLPMKKFLFIRKEQESIYSKWKPWYTLILQTRGTDIGLVRRNIVRYCSKNGYDWVFMLDDDVFKVETIGKRPDGSMTPNRIIAGVSGPRMEIEAFKAWFMAAKKYSLSLSSPNHRTFDRFNRGTVRVNKAACTAAVLLHVPDVRTVGNYKSLHETGNEDSYIQYKLMDSDFRTGKVGSVEYDCPVAGSGTGGNEEEYSALGSSMAQRYELYIDLFFQRVCDDHSLFRVKTQRNGQKSLQFIWKNWNGFSEEIPLASSPYKKSSLKEDDR